MLETIEKIANGGATIVTTIPQGTTPDQARGLIQAGASLTQASPDKMPATSSAAGAQAFTPVKGLVVDTQVYVRRPLSPLPELSFIVDGSTVTGGGMTSVFMWDAIGVNACRSNCQGSGASGGTAQVTGIGGHCDSLVYMNNMFRAGFANKIIRMVIEDSTGDGKAVFSSLYMQIMRSNNLESSDSTYYLRKFIDRKQFDNSAITVTFPEELSYLDMETAWRMFIPKGRSYTCTIEFAGRYQM